VPKIEANNPIMKKKIYLYLTFAALTAACQESLEQRAAREAREMTETKCPMPIGDNMYLDSVVFDIPTLTQSQYYRVYGELDNDSLFEGVDTRTLLLEELKNSPSYKVLMERNVDFHYVYRSNTNLDVVYLELTLTPEDYK
jgi:hypothetical protein